MFFFIKSIAVQNETAFLMRFFDLVANFCVFFVGALKPFDFKGIN